MVSTRSSVYPGHYWGKDKKVIAEIMELRVKIHKNIQRSDFIGGVSILRGKFQDRVNYSDQNAKKIVLDMCKMIIEFGLPAEQLLFHCNSFSDWGADYLWEFLRKAKTRDLLGHFELPKYVAE